MSYYWVPHLTEVWALASPSSDGTQLYLCDAIDSETDHGLIGSPVPLSVNDVIAVARKYQDASEIYFELLKKKNIDVPSLLIAANSIENLAGDTNEASILYSLKKRFVQDQIYSNIGRIVIALNPCTQIANLYTEELRSNYASSNSPYKLPPHLYQIGAAAMLRLGETGTPQSVLITGESGAGKTQSTKLILEYIASASAKKPQKKQAGTLLRAKSSRRYHQQTGGGDATSVGGYGSSLEERLLKVNPVLEAFGNAMTSRNPNSSRFGKWIEVYFSSNQAIAGASIMAFLLELPRVTGHANGERGFHVFYHLLEALSVDLSAFLGKYQLEPKSPQRYRFLRHDDKDGPTHQFEVSDDMEGFTNLKLAMVSLHFEPAEQDEVFSILASLLHLGNLEFVTSQISNLEFLKVSPSCRQALDIIASLIGISAEIVERSLTFREVKSGQREVIEVPLKISESRGALEGFVKLIYGCLFDWILYRCNKKLLTAKTDRFFGILDIAGFECFTVNGFEQFCINLSNERIQSQFNYDTFQAELNIFAEEGIQPTDVSFQDNAEILDLMEGRRGILSIVDEELAIPKGSDKGILFKIKKTLQEVHPNHLSFPKVGSDKMFTINHFAGSVTYTVSNWLEKNRYSPPPLAAQALASSSCRVVQQMISSEVTNRFTAPPKITVGGVFKRQLEELANKIATTEAHYVRCLKPNATLTPRGVDSGSILHQLRSSGALEAVKIRRNGFPVRLGIVEFVKRFSILCDRRLQQSFVDEDPTTALPQMIDFLSSQFGLNVAQLMIGSTRVFLKESALEQLEQLRRLALGEPATRIQSAWRGYVVRRNAKTALALSRQLRPLLGAGVQLAKQQQGGLALYPTSLIAGVESGSRLLEFVESYEQVVEECVKLPVAYQPTSIITKAQDVLTNLRVEAEIVDAAERLLARDARSAMKAEAVLQRAAKHQIKNKAIDGVAELLEKLNYEATLLEDATKAINQGDENLCREWYAELTHQVEINGPFVTQRLASLHRGLGDLERRTPQILPKQEGLTRTQSILRQKTVTEQEPSSEYSYDEEDEDDDYFFSSDEEESEVEEGGIVSAGKLVRELRTAVEVLDCQRIDLLLQRAEEEGEGVVLQRARLRHELARTSEVRAKLNDAEWITERIKETVLEVVWGASSENAAMRLRNLVLKAEDMGVNNADIEAGRRALACLRAAPSSAAAAEDKVTKFANAVVTTRGVYDLASYPGLKKTALVSTQPAEPNFLARLFRRRRGLRAQSGQAKDPCRFSIEPIHSALTEVGSMGLESEAVTLFHYLQYYMGDKPNQPGRDYLAETIVNAGLARRELRDEIFVQIMKQLRGNPMRSSEKRGWALLLYCVESFCPSLELEPFLRYFLAQRAAAFSGDVYDDVGELARQAVRELEATSTRAGGERRKPRPPKVGDAEEREWNADVVLRLADESRQRVAIDAYTTLGDLAETICQRLNMDSSGWAVMIENCVDQSAIDISSTLLRGLSTDWLARRLCRSALLALWGLPQFRMLPDTTRVWDVWDPAFQDFPKLVFRRRLISVSEMLYPHPYHSHLTYKQLLGDFRNYSLPESLAKLCCVSARILVAEKWTPPLALAQQPRTRAITFAELHRNGFIPAVHATSDEALQEQWGSGVRSLYASLDPEEHQLLSINYFLMDMRRLKAFGGQCWLVSEPSASGFQTLTAASRLCAAYKDTTVALGPEALQQALRQAPTSEVIQPMTLTAADLEAILSEPPMLEQAPEGDANQSRLESPNRFKSFFRKLRRKLALRTKLGAGDEALGSPGSVTRDGEVETESGVEPVHAENLNLPLWMSFNSEGIHFHPAISYSESHVTQAPSLCIPSSSIFACETLWLFDADNQVWVTVGLLICAALGEDTESNWTLFSVVPLSTNAPIIATCLKAFLPSLNVYLDLPKALQGDGEESTNEGGETAAVETTDDT